MTNLKGFNFYIQAIFFAAVITVLATSLFIKESIWMIFYMQLGIGIYQLGLGILYALSRRAHGRFRLYAFLAMLNLGILWSLFRFQWIDNEIVVQFFFVVTPWILAVYFFLLSYRYFKQS